MTKFKKLSKQRAVSIPKDMAAHLNLNAGDPVDLTATEDGVLIISKHVDTCRFCGGANNAKRYKDIIICPVCAQLLCSEVMKNE